MTNISPHIAPVYWIVLLFFITVLTWKTLELGGVMFIYMLLTIWEGENATHLLLVCQMLALAILSKVWVETEKSLEGLKLQEKLPRELLASGKTPNLWVQCSGSSCRKKYPYLLVWDRTVFKSSTVLQNQYYNHSMNCLCIYWLRIYHILTGAVIIFSLLPYYHQHCIDFAMPCRYRFEKNRYAQTSQK